MPGGPDVVMEQRYDVSGFDGAAAGTSLGKVRLSLSDEKKRDDYDECDYHQQAGNYEVAKKVESTGSGRKGVLP